MTDIALRMDRIYKKFIALADEIKVIEDHHLTRIISSELAEATAA